MRASKFFELHCAKITVLFCCVMFPFFFTKANCNEWLVDIHSDCIALFASFAGFLFTALSILVTFPDKTAVRMMKSSKAYQGIIRYISAAIKWSVFSLCLALLQFFLDKESIWPQMLSYLVFAIYCGTLVAIARVIHLFDLAISLLNKE